MNMRRFIARLWLSIIAINFINIVMLLSNIRYLINPQLHALKHELHNIFEDYKTRFEDEASVKDVPVDLDGYMPKSQLERVRKNNVVRVAVMGKKAYWVHDNTFYETDIEDGEIKNEKARAIDAHSLSDIEFAKLLSILDNINNG